jgi:hypothetical protein
VPEAQYCGKTTPTPGLAPGRTRCWPRVGPLQFHALRHFCASSLLAEGAPLTAVAGHLGDTVETVSSVYVHWLRDDHDVPAAVLDRVLAPAAEYQLEYFGGSIGLSTPRFPRSGA